MTGDGGPLADAAMPDLKHRAEDLERAAGEPDVAALNAACAQFIAELPRQPDTIPAEMARELLRMLRRHRRFEQMRRIAEAIIDDGCEDCEVKRQYAQALIEGGLTTPAIGLLEGMLAKPGITLDERKDAKGLLGRAWKAKAVAARGNRDAVAARALRNAFDSYTEVYRCDPGALYQGVNRIALAAWDRGLALTRDETEEAIRSAPEIIARVEAKPTGDREPWDLAAAGEASIALGRKAEAINWFKDYALHSKTDSFALSGTIRQLTDLWKLGDSEEGHALLAPLRAQLVLLPGGSFSISPQDAQHMATVTERDYELVLGDAGPQAYTWMRKGLDLASSVALVKYSGTGIGTGFIVRGSDLHPGLGDELFILTNAHVVADPPRGPAIHPRDASVTITIAPPEANPGQVYEVEKIVWQSPMEEHDASLLKLSPKLPAALKPVSMATRLPTLDGKQKSRLYIIGHPGGGELSFSFEDNELLDYEVKRFEAENDPSPCRVHYRTPTRKGNSGSPVFNADWFTIALHHAGSEAMTRLNGQPGQYEANEGIWVGSIRRAMKARPP
jgi:V8-like Glu-specific endopeptidase